MQLEMCSIEISQTSMTSPIEEKTLQSPEIIQNSRYMENFLNKYSAATLSENETMDR